MIQKMILALVILCFGPAFAQQPAGLHPSYVSIKMRSDGLDTESRISAICGGVVVEEKRRIVATGWHCVPNSRSLIEKPGMFFVGNTNARLVAFSAEADLALFQVDDLQGLKAPKFSTPKEGDTLIASAYYDAYPVLNFPLGSADKFFPIMTAEVVLHWEGKVVAVATASRRGGEKGDQLTKTSMKWIVVQPGTVPGFSGGPVFDIAGDFAGTVSSGNAGVSNFSSSENVIQLLKDLRLD